VPLRQVAAVRGLSLEVRKGELVTLIGANGAGKTTTLKAISGVLPPAGGRVRFEGEDITRASARRVLQLGIAHCPKAGASSPTCRCARTGDGLLPEEGQARHRVRPARIYERFPILSERRAQAAGTLSGGEQQMLAISRPSCRAQARPLRRALLGLAPNIVEKIFDIIRQIAPKASPW